MSVSVATRCGHCQAIVRLRPEPGKTYLCPHCEKASWTAPARERQFEACMFCGCEHFYRLKDFNKYLGLGVIVVAALLVPRTYGLSMAAAFLIDWALYARTPEMVKCYRCQSEFRGYPIPDGIRLYDHYTAERVETEQPD